jgi:hypothetical protein
MDFPRLLVVTEFPPNSTPPLTIQCLKGYPPEQIYWWSCKPETSIFLGQEYARHFHARLQPRLLPHQRFAAVKSGLLERFWMPLATWHLQKIVNQVRPQQIWANLYGWAIGPVHFSKLTTRAPTHATIWDYPDIAPNHVRWGFPRCQRMLDWALSVYGVAASRSVISEEMRDDLAAKTRQKDSIIIHSGLEDADVENLAKPAAQPDGVLRIAYAGGINAPDSFSLFVEALVTLRQRARVPIHLEFFGAEQVVTYPWFDVSWMSSHGVLKESELMHKLARCDWGFLAMEISGPNLRYSRYSFPNKFGTYIAAGLPILLLSNFESAAARVMKRFHLGVHLDHAQLEEHLLRVLRMPDPRKAFRNALLNSAKSEFNMPRIRKDLWNCLGVISS